VSTDTIMPAGSKALPYRSNILKLSEFAFGVVDETYPERARECRDSTGHLVVGGANYGQGSSREHAAIVPRYLGLRAVVAQSYARIHWQNLVNFGVLPLEFVDESDYDEIETGDVLSISGIRGSIGSSDRLTIRNTTRDTEYGVRHRLSPRQVEVLLTGGLIPWLHERRDAD
jgi:aconitate hydratase